jgi:MFS family permease
MSAGSFLGALAAGAICDSVGRRKSLMLASVIWIIGSAIQCSSQNVAQLIVGRIVSGLAVGITSSQVVSNALDVFRAPLSFGLPDFGNLTKWVPITLSTILGS